MTKKFQKKRWMMIPVFILAILLFGLVVMGLWNAILPDVIGVKTISFWQGLGILALSKILFGGFSRGWKGQQRGRWIEMKEKFAAMSPEEREKFTSQWRNRCAT